MPFMADADIADAMAVVVVASVTWRASFDAQFK